LTFTWTLVKEANCEIIRGEVSIFRGEAGGLSYVSCGSLRFTLVVGASCPEAMGINKSESRYVKRLTFSIRKRIIIRSSVFAVLNYRKEATCVKVKTGRALNRADPAL
jgi:hypothetical protein